MIAEAESRVGYLMVKISSLWLPQSGYLNSERDSARGGLPLDWAPLVGRKPMRIYLSIGRYEFAWPAIHVESEESGECFGCAVVVVSGQLLTQLIVSRRSGTTGSMRIKARIAALWRLRTYPR